MQQVCHQSIIRWDVAIAINQCTVHMISVKLCFLRTAWEVWIGWFLVAKTKRH